MRTFNPENLETKMKARTLHLPNYLLDMLDKHNQSAHLRVILRDFVDYLENITMKREDTTILTFALDDNLTKKIYYKYLKPRYFMAFTDFVRHAVFWYFNNNYKIYGKECYYCGKSISPYGKNTLHINIQQKPSLKEFCSQECKEVWMYNIRLIEKHK